MSQSRSNTHRPASLAIRVGIVLLAVIVLALLAFYLVVRSRAGALQKGSAFSFDYQVTSTAEKPSIAYSTLEALGGLSGRLDGQSSGNSLFLSWYADGKEEPFTDLYLKDSEVLLNIHQIYRTFLSGLSAKYPLIGSLIPDWTLGDYVTQDQLATLTGRQPAVSEMENYSASAFSPSSLERVYPENALDGYLYFTPKQPLGDAVVTIGFPVQSLWTEFFRCQVLIDVPSQGLHLEMTGKALPGDYDIQLPTSVMKDEDIAALSEIIQAVRSLVDLVSEMVG